MPDIEKIKRKAAEQRENTNIWPLNIKDPPPSVLSIKFII